jgi:hypothetical protein
LAVSQWQQPSLCFTAANSEELPVLQVEGGGSVRSGLFISWARAATRRRGLSRTVIHKLEEHVACTKVFEQSTSDNSRVLCRHEGTIEDAAMQVISQIYKVL